MLLLETQYFPCIAWCTLAWQQQEIALEATGNYQKGSLRNRCHIAGPNGMQRLSIPLVKGKHQQTPIREVRISYEIPWQRQHWRSIMTAYGNAPYFEHYAGDIQPFFEKRSTFLFDFNLELMHLILNQKLGWTGRFLFQAEYIQTGAWKDGPDFRDRAGSGTGAFPEWFSPLKYPQVFEARTGFLPNVSILDLLFCFGRQGREVLAQPLILPN